MADSIRDVMTSDPRTVDAGDPLEKAAAEMRDADAGAVIVTENGEAEGIITDRDITVRAVAEGRGPDTPTAEAATRGLEALSPDDSVDDAVRIMREHGIRRVPVVEDGRPVGIVALGDVAEERDEDSALADISGASPNN